MISINGNIPSIKNSKSIDQAEIQNAKQNMNSAAGKNMILGAELTSNISNAASQASLGNMANSIPNLNSTTSIGSEELQNVKNKVQKSGNNNGLF